MKILTGQVARGDNYFERPAIHDRVYSLLKNGAHILIAAPRRVGKTSLMEYVAANPPEGFSFITINTESVEEDNEFFRRLFSKLTSSEYIRRIDKVRSFIEEHTPKIDRISKDGFDISGWRDVDYFPVVASLLKKIDPSDKLVIMIDEFSQTLQNIIENDGEKAAKRFLEKNRELRQDKKIGDKVQFIFAGSIGLENIVTKLSHLSTINDVTPVSVPPLTDPEAHDLIQRLAAGVDIKVPKDVRGYIINRIKWTIPFYIQIVLDQAGTIITPLRRKTMKREDVDDAFAQLTKQDVYFEHWRTRLETLISREEYRFVKELLNYISVKGRISKHDAFNMAVKHNLEEEFKFLLKLLIYDGYIVQPDSQEYVFNSPLLETWWRENVAE